MSLFFRQQPIVRFYAPGADKVSLLIEGVENALSMRKNRHGSWRVRLPQPLNILHGREYSFEVRHQDKVAKVADPLALRTERRNNGIVSIFSHIDYQHQHSRFRTPKIRDIVIYETHLPALSRHASAQLESEKQRGTYEGAGTPAILDYFKKLGVAVEFLPLHAHDDYLGRDWGYFSTSFNAFRGEYARNPEKINHEVMALVDAMHGAGIPVLLDVVFNHGGELLVKAWGEDVVYRRHGNGDFCHGSGCGPTIQTEHPQIRETVISTLQTLVKDYRFDGFRFDLGALHDKETMQLIHDKLPKHIYLISEPWALGGTQWGKGDLAGDLSGTRWAVWNDDFREPGRTFIKGQGDHHNRDRLIRAISGSHIADDGWTLRPQQSINYLSCHDGKTLPDLLDGSKHRVFLGVMLTLVSQGVPMLYEGTELMYSKRGHHNTYDRPDLNQIDWTLAEKHRDLLEAITGLIELRKKHSHFRYTDKLLKSEVDNKNWDINWIFPTGFPHHDNHNAIGFAIRAPAGMMKWFRGKILVVLLNGSYEAANFHLPKGKWKLIADGHRIRVDAKGIKGISPARGDYTVHPGTGVILAPAGLFG